MRKPAKHPALHLSLAGMVGILLFIATYPAANGQPLSATLDGSWPWEINRLASGPYAFGRDVVFTYGPLGYLFAPTDVGAHLALAGVYRLVSQAAISVIATVMTYRAGSVLLALFFVAIEMAAISLGLDFEYQLLLVPSLLAAETLRARSRVGLGLLGLVAAAQLFVKTSLGVAALSACALLILLWRPRTGALGRRAAATLLLGSYLTSLLLGATLLLRSAPDLAPWLRASLDASNEYSVAMSFAGPSAEVTSALMAVVVFTALVGSHLARGSLGSREGNLAALFAGTVFIAFKHAMVRQDAEHVLTFFPFLLAATGYVLLASSNATSSLATAAVMVLFGGLSLWFVSSHPEVELRPWRSIVSGRSGARNLILSLDIDRQRDLERQQLAEATDHFPSLSPVVGSRRVGVVPWTLLDCPVNELDCVPNPTLQTYYAYTSRLDELSARHYSGPDAPDLVLFEFVAIDDRHVLLEAPGLSQALLSHYRASSVQPASGRLLLEKRGEPTTMASNRSISTAMRAHEWTDVPVSGSRVLANVEFTLTAAGKLAKALFRIPPIYVDLGYCSGRSASYRVVPDTARDGLPLWAVPSSAAALSDLFSGTFSDRVVRLAFRGPGLAYYEQPLPVTWAEFEDPSDVTSCARGPLVALPTPQFLALVYLDELNAIDNPLDAPVVVEAAREPLLTVLGWAVDPVAGRGAAGVDLVWEGGRARIACGGNRPDIAEVYGVPGFADSGCQGEIVTSRLGPGHHVVRLNVISADGRGYYTAQRVLRLEVK